MRRILGWTGLCVLTGVLLVWAASLRWALVWSTTGTVGRIYGGRIHYGSYETLFVEAKWPRVAVMRRTPNDYYGAPCHEVRVSVPLWWGAAPSAACAGLLFLARRRPKGACPRCGYDLGGLAANAPCPECGMAI